MVWKSPSWRQRPQLEAAPAGGTWQQACQGGDPGACLPGPEAWRKLPGPEAWHGPPNPARAETLAAALQPPARGKTLADFCSNEKALPACGGKSLSLSQSRKVGKSEVGQSRRVGKSESRSLRVGVRVGVGVARGESESLTDGGGVVVRVAALIGSDHVLGLVLIAEVVLAQKDRGSGVATDAIHPIFPQILHNFISIFD